MKAVKFTSEVHANFIKEIFKYYSDIDYCKWIKTKATYNTPVKKWVAELLKIIHIPCKNHLLNSEVNYLTHRLLELRQILESVQNTRRQYMQRLYNSAVLRNLSTLKQLMYNKTCWSGMHNVLKRFITIHLHFIEAVDDQKLTARCRIILPCYKL